MAKQEKQPDSFDDPVLRGQRAENLLTDPVLMEAFERAKENFHAQWEAGDSTERREAAWARVHALEEVKTQLSKIVSDGRYEQHKRERGTVAPAR